MGPATQKATVEEAFGLALGRSCSSSAITSTRHTVRNQSASRPGCESFGRGLAARRRLPPHVALEHEPHPRVERLEREKDPLDSARFAAVSLRPFSSSGGPLRPPEDRSRISPGTVTISPAAFTRKEKWRVGALRGSLSSDASKSPASVDDCFQRKRGTLVGGRRVWRSRGLRRGACGERVAALTCRPGSAARPGPVRSLDTSGGECCWSGLGLYRWSGAG